MKELQTAVDVYKAIIDQLVDETRRFGSGSQVIEKGIYSNAPIHREYNEFIQSLSPDQRSLLSKMLNEERDGTIHDVLAALSWWISCREVGFTFRGKPMPVDLSGMGLHGDYVGRRDGWEWPNCDTNEPA
jgi:hypothetical protein